MRFIKSRLHFPQFYGTPMFDTKTNKSVLSYVLLQGRTRGGRHAWGGSFNITSACISLPQAIYNLHCIALHSPKLKD